MTIHVSLNSLKPPLTANTAPTRSATVDGSRGLHVYICQMTSAPDFTLLDQGGEPWTLSDQRGHAVVMLFLRGDW
jgi:hypothetical protein